MTEISLEEVARVARLARLGLQEEELRRLAGQLSQILSAFAKLQELDTTGVEPTAHAIPLHNVFRRDERRPSLPQQAALANAPAEQDGYFRVPRILD